MNLADVFTVVFVIVGLLLVFIGYWLMAAGLFPRTVERCHEQLGAGPIKTTLLGALIFGPLVGLGFYISSHAHSAAGKIFGIAIILITVVVGLFGSAGVALKIGIGLKSSRDDNEPWRRVLRGGIVLSLTFILPFVGTFLVFPIALVAGFGALLLSVFRRGTLPAPAVNPISTSATSLS